MALDHAECVICFDPLHSQTLGAMVTMDDKRAVERRSCKHLVHLRCLEDWMRLGHNTCPVCRARFGRIVKVPHPDDDAIGWFNLVDVDGNGRLDKIEVLDIIQSQFPIEIAGVQKIIDSV